MREKESVQRARELRRSQTPAERLLWSRLRGNKMHGLHFRRQFPYEHYILDFYCDKVRLAIELDGESHDNKKTSDAERDKFLNNQGLKVLRFNNPDVYENLNGVVQEIENCCLTLLERK